VEAIKPSVAELKGTSGSPVNEGRAAKPPTNLEPPTVSARVFIGKPRATASRLEPTWWVCWMIVLWYKKIVLWYNSIRVLWYNSISIV
jgi:hypothetical protein